MQWKVVHYDEYCIIYEKQSDKKSLKVNIMLSWINEIEHFQNATNTCDQENSIVYLSELTSDMKI